MIVATSGGVLIELVPVSFRFFSLMFLPPLVVIARCCLEALGYLAHGAPGQGAVIPGYGTNDVDDSGGILGDSSRFRNEIEVVIVACKDLSGRGEQGVGSAPAAYVHYQVRCESIGVIHGLPSGK